MSGNDIVKNDINFLEYPIWVLSKVEGNKVVIERENGTYTLKSSERLPTDTDVLLLYYLLSKVFDPVTGKCSLGIETTRYDIAMNVYNTRNSYIYDRIIESLKRWSAIFICFKGLFHGGNGSGSMGFHFIESFKMNLGDNKLSISFNREFINHLNTTKYFRYISFEELKKLKRPVSRRLFELLLKTFKDRDTWCVSTDKLTEKLTLSEKYPSQLLKKLRPAINEINGNTELSVSLDTYKNKNDETVFRFKKKCQLQRCNVERISHPEKTVSKKSDRTWIHSLIPEEHRNSPVLDIVDAFDGDDKIIVSNIRYVNSRSYDDYFRYLSDSFNNDWGKQLRIQEDEQLKIYDETINDVADNLFESHGVDPRITPYMVLDILKDTFVNFGNDRFFNSDYVITKVLMEESRPWRLAKK